MKFFAMIYSVLHPPPHTSCNSFSVSIFCIISIFLTSALLSVFPVLSLPPWSFTFSFLSVYTCILYVRPTIHPFYHPSIFSNCSCFLFGPCFLFLCYHCQFGWELKVLPLSFCLQLIVLPNFTPFVYGITRSVRPSVSNYVEFILKKKRTERQTRSCYYRFIVCAVHYILLRDVGRGMERKERCWKCRHNVTYVARYVCCLIITNDRSVNIKRWLLQDLQLFFTIHKMSAWCGEHVRPPVIYQCLKRPSYCDIRHWSYFKKL